MWGEQKGSGLKIREVMQLGMHLAILHKASVYKDTIDFTQLFPTICHIGIFPPPIAYSDIFEFAMNSLNFLAPSLQNVELNLSFGVLPLLNHQ